MRAPLSLEADLLRSLTSSFFPGIGQSQRLLISRYLSNLTTQNLPKFGRPLRPTPLPCMFSRARSSLALDRFAAEIRPPFGVSRAPHPYLPEKIPVHVLFRLAFSQLARARSFCCRNSVAIWSFASIPPLFAEKNPRYAGGGSILSFRLLAGKFLSRKLRPNFLIHSR